VSCKVTTLEDWIEKATKEQQGKNGHMRLVTYLLFLLLLNTSNKMVQSFRCNRQSAMTKERLLLV